MIYITDKQQKEYGTKNAPWGTPSSPQAGNHFWCPVDRLFKLDLPEILNNLEKLLVKKLSFKSKSHKNKIWYTFLIKQPTQYLFISQAMQRAIALYCWNHRKNFWKLVLIKEAAGNILRFPGSRNVSRRNFATFPYFIELVWPRIRSRIS